MSRLVSFLTPVVVLSFVAGCGGSSSSVDSSGTARATLTFTWPQRSRLIPIASNSIKISISNGTTTFEKLVTRPDAVNSTTTQITFDKVNSGNYQVTATAYPNADGTGRPQALGTTSLSISQGQTTNFNITMDSTVTQVKIVGPLSLVANVPTTFTAQAIDSANYLVLVDPSTLQWTAGTNLSLTGGPTVFSDSVTVTGTAVGADDLILTYVEPTVGRPTVTRNLTISGQIGVVLAPATQTILPGDSLVLQATVVNGSNPNVTWNVTGASTTTSSGTSITITAPNASGSAQVVAASVQDPTKTATSSIVVASNATVTVSPSSPAIEVNQTQVFTATVANASNTAVTWSASGGATILSSTATQANIKMPATAGNVTVTATSQFDTTKVAQVQFAVAAATGSASGTVRGKG